MRKWLFAIGLILLFVGVIFASSSYLPHRRLNPDWEIIKTDVNVWQISSSLTEGDKVKLVVFWGADWLDFLRPPTLEMPFYHKFVYVNITDPYGVESQFEVTYMATERRDTLYIYNVSLESPSNGLSEQDIDISERQNIVGKVLYSGPYNATVVGYSPPGGGPPSVLTFSREEATFLIEYPFSNLLYPGVVVFASGVILSIWSAKTPERRIYRKRRPSVKGRSR